MSIPTRAEVYSQLLEYLIKSQESCAIMAHLHSLNDEAHLAHGWLGISELLKRMQVQVTKLAQGRMQ